MAEFDYPNGDLLVSAAWLAQHLHDSTVKIIDARSAKDYTAGHISGAVLLPNGAFRSTRGVPDACTPQEFAATAGALGVRASDTVVCYDGTGGARTWWVFARFGHRDVRFLNVAASLVQTGLGVAIVDELTGASERFSELMVRPFRPRITIVVNAIHAKDKTPSRLAQLFLEHARAEVQPI